MTRRLLVIGHDYLETAGSIEGRFAERGYAIESVRVVPADRLDDPGVDFDFPDPREYDAVLVLGARWSAYSDTVASWVKPETELLRSADEAGVPVFGICFGGQMLAQAHGGSVAASPVPEIGPSVVTGVPAVVSVEDGISLVERESDVGAASLVQGRHCRGAGAAAFLVMAEGKIDDLPRAVPARE